MRILVESPKYGWIGLKSTPHPISFAIRGEELSQSLLITDKETALYNNVKYHVRDSGNTQVAM